MGIKECLGGGMNGRGYRELKLDGVLDQHVKYQNSKDVKTSEGRRWSCDRTKSCCCSCLKSYCFALGMVCVATLLVTAIILDRESSAVHQRLVGQYDYHQVFFDVPKDRPVKILQIADIQLESLTDQCVDYKGTCDTFQSIRFIEKVIMADVPDLIVFNGDNVVGKHGDENAKTVIQTILKPVKTARIPFVAILGNHDVEEYHMSVSQMHDHFRDEGALFSGNGVLHMRTDNHTLCDVFFFDYMHHMGILWGFYRFLPTHWLVRLGLPTGVSRYGTDNGITRDQRDWFQYQTKRRSAASAIMFVHVPLPEYSSLNLHFVTGSKNEGMSTSSSSKGSLLFWNTLTSASVDVVSAGHDHVNDFCGQHSAGPYLCYAGGAGYTTYGLADWSRRVRYFVIQPTGQISTYKVLDDEYLSAIDLQNMSTTH